MLQCHPHPAGFSDKSRPFHCSYFMGLQRKQGVPANGGELYDMRITVDEFKQAVANYMMWKPGMEIHVSHVRRRNIPTFVFPDGVRPRPARSSGEKRRVSSEQQNPGRVCENTTSVDISDCKRRRMLEDGKSGTELIVTKSCSEDVSNIDANESGESWIKNSKSRISEGSERFTDMPAESSGYCGAATESVNPVELSSATNGTTSFRESEKHNIEVIKAGPNQLVAELGELEESSEYRAQADSLGMIGGSGSGQSPTKPKVVVTEKTSNGAHVNRHFPFSESLEELEATDELPVPSNTGIHPISAVQRKPVIRLNLTSMAKATGTSN